MSSDDKRNHRKRLYSLVTLALVCIVGLVAMSTLLARGQLALDEKVYRYPHKTLYHLFKAQRRFHRKKKHYAKSLEEMGDADVVTKKLTGGLLGGYRYAVVSADAQEWGIGATPVAVSSSSLFYYVDQSGIVRAKVGAAADGTSEVYWSPYREGWGQ